MKHAFRLPWTSDSVPHAVIDILRGCNIRCRDCYNLATPQLRSLAEIEAQLDTLQRLRRLHSLSIVGGEPTLHPDLPEIVRRVRQCGLFVELFTNGVALDDSLLANLKRAGANVIFLHVEPGQQRPDLPTPDAASVRRLRAALAERVAAHGIEVGLAATAYPGALDEVAETVGFTLESPFVDYLLVTWWRDVARMPPLVGDLARGIASGTGGACPSPTPDEIRAPELCRWLAERFSLRPFAFLGSNRDPGEPRWLSFLVGAVHRRGHLVRRHSLRPTMIERAFLVATRRMTGRYPFYQPQRAIQTGLHLLLNGLAGGGPAGNLALLGRTLRPGARLSAKRLLFQWPASLDEHGNLVHCDCCPDAVLNGDRLVPLCISDRVGLPLAVPYPACAAPPAPL